jgi:hypothetical protein
MRFMRSANLALIGLICGIAAAQAPLQKPPAKKLATHRANELTLAGLRPGREIAKRAEIIYKHFKRIDPKNPSNDAQTVWLDECRHLLLAADIDNQGKIQVLRASQATWLVADCAALPPGPWKTGLGLRVGDPANEALHLYGEPDSRSPSTKGGQPLELWYYAFDWAGPEVPQVMEVLCSLEKDGQPGRVVEITLAAPSL